MSKTTFSQYLKENCPYKNLYITKVRDTSKDINDDSEEKEKKDEKDDSEKDKKSDEKENYDGLLNYIKAHQIANG